jgi:hypothetical protein
MVTQFTKHALKQIKIRKLEKADINATLNDPDKIMKDRFQNFIAQKKFGNYLLRVVYLHEKDIKIIITAYKTSKFNKYI